jgi:multiple sugar transport system permease protein
MAALTINPAARTRTVARRRRSHRRLVVHILAVLILVVTLAPLLWMVQMSFHPSSDVLTVSLAFHPSFENYRALWTGRFPASFGNSLITSSVSTLLALLVGTPAAYSLSRWRFRARRKVALWILATRMAPPIAFTIPFFLAYRYLHLSDTVTGLIIIYLTFNLPLVIWTMSTFFDGVPQSLEEAAWTDGCSIWQAFLRITLPLSVPGLAATTILCFILSWNDFFFALILTRTNAMTAPVAIVNFMQYEGWEWGKIAAAGTLVMLPVVAFTFVVRTYLVHGLMAGGLKE